MAPLVTDKKDAVWQCWTKHVAVVRFCTRHVFALKDRQELDKLNAEFLKSFQAVAKWQDSGYEKPKFHPPEHLGHADQ